MVDNFLEIFMDDLSISGDSFDKFLGNLKKVLKRCEEVNLVLNWEKCPFMVTECILLNNKISQKGIEVDKVKIEVNEKFSPPTIVKAIRSFLGHASFYKRFIKDLSKISKPLCTLMQQNQLFVFDKFRNDAFTEMKQSLISVPIIVTSYWTLSFELMYDANDYAMGAMLEQCRAREERNLGTMHDFIFGMSILVKRCVDQMIRRKVKEKAILGHDGSLRLDEYSALYYDPTTKMHEQEIFGSGELCSEDDYKNYGPDNINLNKAHNVCPENETNTGYKGKTKEQSRLLHNRSGINETLPLIISVNLTSEQENSLLNVLSQHKKALGWTMEA
ncbi:uncharacterized protein LOC120181113 [Hibiscus syriacus]|uniref:uncharacterized protein LOC120181113 n=1 Tax=Hibiscus syriacus TaxID=106335 RepID=UPI0019231137|nr:uncharacterized protein LOC120181113 [Hibiscus syriacus]